MDKRLIKTKETLKNALGELMLEKDVSRITIKELTEKSKINRGTFYLHYNDINSLLNEIENDLIEGLVSTISQGVDLNSSFEIYSQLMKFFEFTKKEKLLFRVLTSRHGDIVFLKKLKQTLLSSFTIMLSPNPDYDSNSLHFFFSFLVSGIIGVCQEWLSNDCVSDYKNLIIPCELIIKDAVINLYKLKK